MGSPWTNSTRSAKRKLVTATLNAADYFNFSDGELAQYLDVSRLTVKRWRQGGLVSRADLENKMRDLVAECARARHGFKTQNPKLALRPTGTTPDGATEAIGATTPAGPTQRPDPPGTVPPAVRVLYDFAHRLPLAQWADLFRSLAAERTGR